MTVRNAWIQEGGFSRLKGKPLGASPLFVQRDDQAKGLMHLLSLGLRILTLIEFVVQRRLKQQNENCLDSSLEIQNAPLPDPLQKEF
ncbi:hypothetical protein [Acaryochloris sp. CCMEE 5410]|uniref:hypothetical protein n=1 Tax=Acaryochloris sp. CCMEE 5410 TaxID=310037 RepID=UPI0021CE91CA|nr:hypothetical protein [Acaryochloris sp. CCMEE 5410]